jgi:hypothetical protein
MASQSRKGLAEVFMNCKALVLVDVSGSMELQDCGGRTRFEVASERLICLQRDHPGSVGIVPWNHNAYFAPNGLPADAFGGTDLVKALSFIKSADGCGMKFIVISDGCPEDEAGALQLASTFKTKIDTIYVGPEGPNGEAGRKFMRDLAGVSGGVVVSQSVKEIGILDQTIGKLLNA